ncbi:tRNA methyltransferase 10 homolog B [Microcaecilia unicolor]|uniref:tRNA methyltransferase 10 homolog B n=1 Tax=Microcaecilia unicolor TaxID=1415580 RepID=A0A6P7XCI2_9AMPH|nr:tRNA methyltransferase 10 homolog B [Microcaecilia unicolor]
MTSHAEAEMEERNFRAEVDVESVGEDEASESLLRLFQLFQIEAECNSSEVIPQDNEMWCSRNVLRKQRNWEKIVAAKKSKRKQEKERRKAKHIEGTEQQHSKRVLKAIMKERLLEAKHAGPRLCIDLSVSDHMTKKEISKLAAQIRRLYGANKRAAKPFWLCVTGLLVHSSIHEECLRMNDGFSNYLMDTTEEHYFDLFPLERIVYLTPDSKHALEEIDPQKVYILGGLVDENIQKKLTFQKACEQGLQTARLPIQEYMIKDGNMKNFHSEILAINQVFDVLAMYYKTGSWPEALKAGVPARKGFVLPGQQDVETKKMSS